MQGLFIANDMSFNPRFKSMEKIIMTVNQTHVHRHQIRECLENAGYYVIEAKNTEDALLKLEKIRVHLIITGSDMINQKDSELFKKIKEDDYHKHIPLIIINTNNQLDDLSRLENWDQAEWFQLPFEPKYFLNTIRKVLLQNESGINKNL